MPKLEITLKEKYNKRTKQIYVFCDGQEIGTVYNSETEEFDINAGQHKVKAKTGWYGSQEYNLSVDEGETKALKVAVFKYGNMIISSFFIILILHFIANTFLGIKYIALLNIPGIFIMLYYLTLGRNNYLVIEEAN